MLRMPFVATGITTYELAGGSAVVKKLSQSPFVALTFHHDFRAPLACECDVLPKEHSPFIRQVGDVALRTRAMARKRSSGPPSP